MFIGYIYMMTLNFDLLLWNVDPANNYLQTHILTFFVIIVCNGGNRLNG